MTTETHTFEVLPGNYTIRLHKDGYHDITHNVTITQDTTLDYTNDVFELIKYLVTIKVLDGVTLEVRDAQGQVQAPDES